MRAQTQIVEERGAAGHQLFENEIKAAQARGTALTAAGQAGVDGSASTAAVMQDYFSRERRGNDAVIGNYTMTRDNIAANELSAMGTATSRINSVQQAAPPNFFDAGLRIAGAGLAGAGTYYRDTNLQRGWNNPYGGSGYTQSAESYTG
jgi:hypothetical protein